MPKLRLPTRRQVCCDLALAGSALLARPMTAVAAASAAQADRILVHKAERKLILQRDGSVLATFPIALGAHPVGPKREQGDRRTPEGRYQIDGFNPHSHYYRALHISYPNAEDMRRAQEAGLPPGGDIEIHGLPGGFDGYDPVAFFKDWTNGCIAVSNRAIETIWASVALGTAVEIVA